MAKVVWRLVYPQKHRLGEPKCRWGMKASIPVYNFFDAARRGWPTRIPTPRERTENPRP